VEHWRELQNVAAVVGTVIYTIAQPRFWTREARNRVARQVMAVGIEPILFVCAVAILSVFRSSYSSVYGWVKLDYSIAARTVSNSSVANVVAESDIA
jgi:hypothetical protein